MGHRSIASVVVSALICLGSSGPPFASLAGGTQDSAAIHVASGGSVQEAIDSAASGSIVLLGPGIFRGSLVIDHSLTLRGAEEGSVIAGDRFGAAVRIVGDETRVRFEHLTVTGGRSFDGHGIQTEDRAVVEMVDVTSTDNNWCGVWATDRSTLFLEGCRLTANHTFGLYTWDFARVELRDCTISGNETHGILALHASEILLVSSRITGNWSGLWAWDGVRLRAADTAISENTTQGVVAQNGALIELVACAVSRNGDCGLWFSESSRGVLSDCLIQGNGADGVLIEQDGIVEFYRCAIRENAKIGIRAGASECVGGFDPANPFKGWVEGSGNTVPGPEEEGGNHQAALCPGHPGSLWPPDFLDAHAAQD